MPQPPTAGPLVSDELSSTDDNLIAAEIVVSDLTAGAPSDASSFHAPTTDGQALRAAASAGPRMRDAFGWVVGSRVAGILVTLLINIQMARWLSPQDFGSFALMCSVIAFAGALAGLGLSAGVVRFLPESLAVGNIRRAADTLRWSWLLTLLGWAILGTLTVCFWPRLCALLGLPTGLRFAVIAAVSLGLLACMQLTSESLRGMHDLRLASLLSGGQTGGLLSNVALLGATTVAAALYAPSLEQALLLNLGAIALVLPLGWFGLWYCQRVRAKDAAGVPRGPDVSVVASARLTGRELLVACLPLMLIQCITFFSIQADLWIAGANCSPEDVALYGAARRLMLVIVMPLQMANYLVMSSIPALYVQRRSRELQSLLRRTATLFFLPSLLGLSLVVLFGGSILSLLYGDYYRAAAWPLASLAIGQTCLAAAGSAHCALLMTGQQLKALWVNGLAALALIFAGSWAARHLGITGLAAVSALVVSIESCVLTLLARRLIGVWTQIDPFLNWWGMFGRAFRHAPGAQSAAAVNGKPEPYSE